MLYSEKSVPKKRQAAGVSNAEKNFSPQYVLDKAGKKAFVVLPIEEYESLLEDLQDLSVIAERRDEPKLGLEDFERELKADGSSG